MVLRLRGWCCACAVGALRGLGCDAAADVHADWTLKAAAKTFPVEQQELCKMSELFCIFTEKEIFLRLNCTHYWWVVLFF